MSRYRVHFLENHFEKRGIKNLLNQGYLIDPKLIKTQFCHNTTLMLLPILYCPQEPHATGDIKGTL